MWRKNRGDIVMGAAGLVSSAGCGWADFRSAANHEYTVMNLSFVGVLGGLAVAAASVKRIIDQRREREGEPSDVGLELLHDRKQPSVRAELPEPYVTPGATQEVEWQDFVKHHMLDQATDSQRQEPPEGLR